MTSRNGFSRAAATWAAVLLVVSVFTGCGKQEALPQNGSAQVQATLPQGLSGADVVGVHVEVRGPGMPSPISAELTRTASGWQGTLINIPAGTDRIFEASAYDALGTVLYRGSSSPVSIASGGTVSVLLTLQQVTRPPTYENEPPQIDSVVVSANVVNPGGSITLTVIAHDPNGDALSYAWTATAGTFSSASSPFTSWTAPGTEGVQRLQLDVTDSKGTSVSLNFDVGVQRDGATGGADVTIGFNTWPEIRAMQAAPSVLTLGGTTALSVAAVDADGDALAYVWSTDCVGAIANPTASAPSFSLTSAPASGRCAFQVRVSDGRGGLNTGTLVLQLGSTPRINVAPKIDSVWQSATVAGGGQAVTLGITAHDPEGTPVSFSWSTSVGSLISPRWTSGSSEVDWVAPVCFDNPVTVFATVVDADGGVAQASFFITPLDSAKCGPLAVTGQRNIHFVQEDGSVYILPADLSATALGAWVPTADGSSYVYRAGSGNADGSFVIPNVDRTPYFLQFGTNYVLTSSRFLDLSVANLGRPDVVMEPAGTQMSFELDGLSPWQFSDDIQLHSTGAGIGYYTNTCASPFLDNTEGATTFMGTTNYVTSLANCGASPAWIDSSRGDFVHATQFVGRNDPGAGPPSGLELQELRRGARIFNPTGFPGSGMLTLKGTLMDLPLFRQDFDVRASQFEALAITAHPSAALTQDSMYMDTLPRFSDYGQFEGSPDLAWATNASPGTGDFHAAFIYGNPYPLHWQRFVVAQASASVPFSVPLADGSLSRTSRYSATITTQLQVMDGMPMSLAPMVGPVRDVRINGLDATGILSGVGTTPMVSWTPPALGTPTRYGVRVYELLATSTGGTTRASRGFFNTTQTQFRLPPGILSAGRNYMFLLYAYYSPASNPDVPFMDGGTFAYAQAFSSRFQP